MDRVLLDLRDRILDEHTENWKDITNNLPPRFGFPMAADSNDPTEVHVVTPEGGLSRVSSGSKFAVWTTDNAGNEGTLF